MRENDTKTAGTKTFVIMGTNYYIKQKPLIDDANRLIYVIKDDGIPAGQMKSVKDEEYIHLRLIKDTVKIFHFTHLFNSNCK